MRVNIYAEEQTDRIELVTAKAETGSEFIGVRFYLKTHQELTPPIHTDDDSGAVTFWVKSSKGGFKPGDELPLANRLWVAFQKLMKPHDLGTTKQLEMQQINARPLARINVGKSRCRGCSANPGIPHTMACNVG